MRNYINIISTISRQTSPILIVHLYTQIVQTDTENIHETCVSVRLTSMVRTNNKMVTKSLETKLSLLSLEDAYIFKFYHSELLRSTLEFLPGTVGSLQHLNFLKKASAQIPHLSAILQTRNRSTFASKAKLMVSMANEALKGGVDPDPFLPKNLKGKPHRCPRK